MAPTESVELEVRGLSFRYSGSEKDTLHDVNFMLHKGERIALVGSNGSGKTTLVKLLLRLYDASEGEILMDGVNVKEYDLKGYRDCFGTVFQDFKMFSLSVKDNVLLRREEQGDDERVDAALKASGAYEKVATLKNGVDSILTREFDDEGVNLSIGEQQKISLARVFAAGAPFVVLDEPSSALDPVAEYEIYRQFDTLVGGKTAIYISHRLSSCIFCDRIAVFDKARLVEEGTHEQLLEKLDWFVDGVEIYE